MVLMAEQQNVLAWDDKENKNTRTIHISFLLNLGNISKILTYYKVFPSNYKGALIFFPFLKHSNIKSHNKEHNAKNITPWW